MRTVGIIAEYNPFHTGHEYHIKQAKELANADYAIVVMSPDFVQRGEPAIFDKYTRARMALQCKADLVLELPVCYATGSAEYFAEGAVRMLDALGIVDALCFGAEMHDPANFNDTDKDAAGYADAFQSIASLLLREPEPYKERLREGLRMGLTFPEARADAAARCLTLPDSVISCEGAEAGSLRSDTAFHYQSIEKSTAPAETLLSFPNNILGVEYCKALQKFHSPITPMPVERKGSPYSDQNLEGDYCSAGAIRAALRNDPQRHGRLSEKDSSLSRYIPSDCAELFRESCRTPIFPDDLLPVLTQKLIRAQEGPSFTGGFSDSRFDRILDISPALSDRIEKLRFDCVGKSFEEITALIKTRQITESRVRRALLHLILDIRRKDVEIWRTNGGVFYAHLLGFRQEAAPLLHEIKKKSALPLLSKAANAPRILSGCGLQMWNQDAAASHLYRSLRTLRYGTPFQSEYKISPVVIEK
ncbi:MAG: nucleotidyltransferase family protein [Clostridiales bacterium]|nr:nucleotidyltransferase family protein [Clostridiales bacterium]